MAPIVVDLLEAVHVAQDQGHSFHSLGRHDGHEPVELPSVGQPGEVVKERMTTEQGVLSPQALSLHERTHGRQSGEPALPPEASLTPGIAQCRAHFADNRLVLLGQEGEGKIVFGRPSRRVELRQYPFGPLRGRTRRPLLASESAAASFRWPANS